MTSNCVLLIRFTRIFSQIQQRLPYDFIMDVFDLYTCCRITISFFDKNDVRGVNGKMIWDEYHTPASCSYITTQITPYTDDSCVQIYLIPAFRNIIEMISQVHSANTYRFVDLTIILYWKTFRLNIGYGLQNATPSSIGSQSCIQTC